MRIEKCDGRSVSTDLAWDLDGALGTENVWNSGSFQIQIPTILCKVSSFIPSDLLMVVNSSGSAYYCFRNFQPTKTTPPPLLVAIGAEKDNSRHLLLFNASKDYDRQ